MDERSARQGSLKNRLEITAYPGDATSACPQRGADPSHRRQRWTLRTFDPMRYPAEEIRGSSREQRRSLGSAEEDHPQRAVGEDRALQVQPCRLIGIGHEDDERALRGAGQAHGVGVDLEIRMRGQQAPDQLAEALGVGLVDEDQDTLLDELEDPVQPGEPGGFTRTRCIVRRGCG